MSRIDAKHTALALTGLDLGAALGPEEDAGYGGRVRRYQNGHIYWHPVMGEQAHEVHGGILAAYLANGGPGVHPRTGRRHLGFPLSDEIDYALATGSGARESRFEWGAIYWNHAPAVAVHGAVYLQLGKLKRGIGFPLTGTVAVAGGEAVYCERGCLWVTDAVPNGVLVGVLEPPQLGHPAVIAPEGRDPPRFARLVRFVDVPAALHARLTVWRPTVYGEIWNDRLALRSVDPPAVRRVVIPLAAGRATHSAATNAVGVALDLHEGEGARPLADRRLYDLVLTVPEAPLGVVSPHSYYAARRWEDFGILHVTDLHLSRRNEGYRERLAALGLQPAAAGYDNFQDGFRAFLTYANLLHAKGLADVVLATGDLVDYVLEADDRPGSGGNFALFERMVLGAAGSEELRLPIFTTLGNHDYRLHPYELLFEVDVPGSNIAMEQHSSHDLTPDEARALQGGKVLTVSPARAVDMLAVDPNGLDGTGYAWYDRRINRDRSYAVQLGAHRVVMLDTGADVGIPHGTDVGDMLTMFWKSVTDGFTEDERQAQTGAPNQGGVGVGGGFELVPAALAAAGEGGGLVIVAMHAPPLSPPGSEYPYYLRETQHPAADARQVPEFLRRRKGEARGWVATGTPHFKTGPVADGLDYGTARARADDFVRLVAGGAGARPADLVLCGHGHDRADFRVRWDAARGEAQYFIDFYTENPDVYYDTVNNFAAPGLPAGHPVHVRVRAGAPVQGRLTVATDHRVDPPRLLATVEVPPYADPLSAAADPRAWWRAHRPLVLQTAALGPIDPRQRFDPRWRVTISSRRVDGSVATRTYTVESVQRPTIPAAAGQTTRIEPLGPQQPNATFQGFRLIQVRGGAIARIRYVTLAELRRRRFAMPWEGELRPPVQAPGGIASGDVTVSRDVTRS